ncbi:MAG: L-asparaginase 1 [Bacteroidetes bacterium]|nr:MAG: L-asparaginase 1 [Bacteroidota bacterium]
MGGERSILIIYTGGTIGSVHDPMTGSLVPIDFSQITSHVPELNRAGISMDAVSFDPPIDSSNVNPSHWRKIAKVIFDYHDKYNGFVVLHGTDTMAYTASALSFMLEGLRKPVILTGSQLPIGMPRTDGRENLLSAVMLAAHSSSGKQEHSTIQEVAVYFGSQLFRGNRTHKESAESLDAIVSPNYPSLVKAGVGFNVRKHNLYRAPAGELKLHNKFESNISWLPLFPGMSFEVMERILNWDELRGVVLGTFGSGNAPDNKLFKSLLKSAQSRGVIMLNITQCGHGGVHQEMYATSLMLADCGVISGGDMTTEAALIKLMMLLGESDNSDQIKAGLLKDLRGERTV